MAADAAFSKSSIDAFGAFFLFFFTFFLLFRICWRFFIIIQDYLGQSYFPVDCIHKGCKLALESKSTSLSKQKTWKQKKIIDGRREIVQKVGKFCPVPFAHTIHVPLQGFSLFFQQHLLIAPIIESTGNIVDDSSSVFALFIQQTIDHTNH